MTLPAPYPADTRAKGWRFEVDMEKVKASDTWLLAKTGEVRGALLLLWNEAWQQTPCGSLPADDKLVALIVDMASAKFEKHRPVLMRGWWLADDGRLYHDTIAERVQAMLLKRAKDAKRAAGNRARKAEPQSSPPEVTGASRVTNTGLVSEFDTKHQAPSTIYSVPKGTDGDAVLTKAELWEAGKSLLSEQGMVRAQCGSFVGKLVKDYGDEVVIDAVRSCVVKRPADAAQYLIATCQHLKGQRQKPDIARQTVPGKQERDPELVKREQDSKTAAKPPAEVLALADRLRVPAQGAHA